VYRNTKIKNHQKNPKFDENNFQSSIYTCVRNVTGAPNVVKYNDFLNFGDFLILPCRVGKVF
jgi:hypothetical protein